MLEAGWALRHDKPAETDATDTRDAPIAHRHVTSQDLEAKGLDGAVQGRCKQNGFKRRFRTVVI